MIKVNNPSFPTALKVLAAGSLLALAACTPEPGSLDDPENIERGRRAVASRSICKVIGLNAHTGNVRDFDGADRTPLALELDISHDDKTKDEAGKTPADYFKQYEHDNGVQWFAGHMFTGDLLNDESTVVNTIQIANTDRPGAVRKIVKEAGRQTIVLNPRKIYKKGTVIDLKLRDPVHDGKGDYLVGTSDCGDITKTNAPGALPGGWELTAGRAQHPPVLENQTELPVWHE